MPVLLGNPPAILTPGSGPNGPGPIDARTQIPAKVSGWPYSQSWTPPDVKTATSIKYVRKTGSDSNGGTSPSDAWQTINKALTTAPAGAVIYVGAGVYRETVSVTITPTRQNPVWIIGDVDGTQTGDAGQVQLTGYTTDDKTAPTATVLLAIGAKTNMMFRNIVFIAGNNTLFTGAAGSQYIAFQDCSFIVGSTGNNAMGTVTGQYGVSSHWLFDRCYFFCGTAASNIALTIPQGTGADYDIDFVFSNCLILNAGGTQFFATTNSGAGSAKAGGIRFRSCTYVGSCKMIGTTTGASTSIPITVIGCFIVMLGNPWATANQAGQIFEDYNYFWSQNGTNIRLGDHSVTNITAGNYAPLFHFGQERIWGGQQRGFMEPYAGSPLSIYGTSDTLAGRSDIKQGPRQMQSSRWAAGALQRSNSFGQEIVTVESGSNAISIIGSGYHDFQVPVTSGATTFTIWCQYDSNYTGPLPQFQTLLNAAIVSGAANVDAPPGQAGTWVQLTLTINPTASGIVVVRVIASDTSGISKTTFDNFQVQ